MKKLICLFAAIIVLAGCTQKKVNSETNISDDAEVNDSTIYGVCGEGTMMHTLELITNMHDTLSIYINDDETADQTLVAGGLMAGDRMAVTVRKTDNGLVGSRILNITSLLGKWTSVDKNFEITDDGEVKSFVRMESNAWTAWRILNGQLLLNRDTFDIINISADSLQIENREGIYAFRRVKVSSDDADHTAKDSLRVK